MTVGRRQQRPTLSLSLLLFITPCVVYVVVVTGMTDRFLEGSMMAIVEELNFEEEEQEVFSLTDSGMLLQPQTNTTISKENRRRPVERNAGGDSSVLDVHNSNPQEAFSACLLIMDDNFRLREWLSYHYHVLPLRHLVVAVDPRSKESPSEILQVFRDELNMTIHEWTDGDFQYNPSNKNPNDGDQLRGQYLMRQRVFLERCIEFFSLLGHRWTLMVDTDEFLTIDPYTRSNVTFVDVMGRRDLEKPGGVLEFIDQGRQQGKFNDSCIIAPRVLFGAEDKAEYTDQSSVPKGFEIDPFRLDTFRWRRHNAIVHKFNGLGKPMVDVSQVKDHLPLKVRNPHRPVPGLCGSPFGRDAIYRSPFRVNHYLGSWEQYSYRDDARKRADRSREAWEFRATIGRIRDTRTHLWLEGFVKSVGLKTANVVLHGAGLGRDFKKNATNDWTVDLSRGVFKRKDDHYHDFLSFVATRNETTTER